MNYPLDGMVIEAIDSQFTKRWARPTTTTAGKSLISCAGGTAETVIEEIGWQTGRTGVVTPVLRVKPVKVSGAMINNITAHHAGMVRDLKLGAGAKIEVIRVER